jgi:hypothetical protein
VPLFVRRWWLRPHLRGPGHFGLVREPREPSRGIGADDLLRQSRVNRLGDSGRIVIHLVSESPSDGLEFHVPKLNFAEL